MAQSYYMVEPELKHNLLFQKQYSEFDALLLLGNAEL